jgi:GNAT superfamily N-acetyltransferase
MDCKEEAGMEGNVVIADATSGKAFKDFIEVAYIIEGKYPHWVPPLRVQIKELFDEKKNPFFENGEMRRYVAYRNGKPVGRIAAIKNNRHNEIHQENTGHFGHFECIDDGDVAAALFDAAETQCRKWGFDKMVGPFNPHINEEMGILLNYYDEIPFVMMTYNPPYYPALIEKQGYAKAMDVFTYEVAQDDMSDKLKRGAEAIRKRTRLRFRKFEKKNFWRDAMKVWEVHGKAWEKNWSAIPFTESEFRHLANNLKSVADFDQIFLAEEPDTDRLVGFSLALPNINEAIVKIRDGRLFPFGLLKILWLTRPKAIKSARIVVMGVLEEYRNRGVDSVFYYDHFIEGAKKGIYRGEMSWILETNTMMNRAAEMMGGKRKKVYRMYQKTL